MLLLYMIKLKTPEEIAIIHEGGKILARILDRVIAAVKPGVSTGELNVLAEKSMREAGAVPAFQGYGAKIDKRGRAQGGFPAVLCTSTNDGVVHCVPSHEHILQDGDIISLDIGIRYKGLFTDMARTVGVGAVSTQAKQLMRITKESLDFGIKQAKPGNTVGHIGEAVQKFVEKNGFSVVRDLVGHGVGHEVHEEPRVPNFGIAGAGEKLVPGMVIAIEPMVNEGDFKIKMLSDGWSMVTRDGKLSAHFEDTIAITDKGPIILTRI